jgi:hypothetical protein
MIDDADDAFGESPDLSRMDARVLAAYRREFGRPGWRRRVRVPLPVAALVLIGLLVSAVAALRTRSAVETAAPAPAADPVQAVRRDLAVVTTQTSLSGFEPVDVDDMQVVTVGRRSGP